MATDTTVNTTTRNFAHLTLPGFGIHSDCTAGTPPAAVWAVGLPSKSKKKAARKAMKSLYDTDFAEWSDRNAELLRAGRFDEVDIENVAEEIESLSKSQQSAVWSFLQLLLMHKIKQVIQPERDGAGWRVSIERARQALENRIADSPSLRPYLQANLQKIYQQALTLALLETDLEHAAIAEQCPWDLDALLAG